MQNDFITLYISEYLVVVDKSTSRVLFFECKYYKKIPHSKLELEFIHFQCGI